MPKTEVKTIAADFIRTAAKWPSIDQLAREYDLPPRFIRSAVERRRVEAIKLDLIRINPESWEAFLVESYWPAE